MVIKHDDLWKLRPGWSMQRCFDYSKQAEQALATLLDINCALAEGNHSEFDFTDVATNKTYEVKFQFKGALTVEFQQAKNSNPSGIDVSTADYWIIVNTYKPAVGDIIGKVRRFKLADLKYATETQRMAGLDNGKQCVLDPWNTPHEWMGDIAVDSVDRTWDLSRWVRKANVTSFKRKPSRHPFPSIQKPDNI